MPLIRCKCGKVSREFGSFHVVDDPTRPRGKRIEFHSERTEPDCVGCAECGTTLAFAPSVIADAQGNALHRPLIAHDHPGPHEPCSRCHAAAPGH